MRNANEHDSYLRTYLFYLSLDKVIYISQFVEDYKLIVLMSLNIFLQTKAHGNYSVQV